MKYVRNRRAMSDLAKEVMGIIRNSGLSASEAIGFTQYMKYPIMDSLFDPKSKEHE